MKYLLDTHTFIWAAVEPSKLSTQVQAIFQDQSHTLFLSLASVWEMQIKFQLGKLTVLTQPIAQVVASQQQTNQIQLMTIDLSHILGLENLPLHHRDPFDRLLISQVIAEGMPILSNDSQFTPYPVQVVW